MNEDAGTRRLLPELPRAAWTVLAGDFISSVGTGLTLPFLLVYLHSVRGIPLGEAGLVLSTVAVASAIGNPLGGWLSDHVGCRASIAAGLIIAAIGSVGLAATRTLPVAFAAASVVGLGVSVLMPSQDALLARLVEAERRSATFAVKYGTMNAGFGVGALIAAAVVRIGHPGSFEAIYVVDGLTFLLYLPVLAAVPSVNPTKEEGDASTAPTRAGRVRRDRTFLTLLALTVVVVTVSYGQFNAAFPAFATRHGGVSPSALSLAFAANTLTVVAVQLFALRFIERRRRSVGIAMAASLFAVSWLVVVAAGSLGRGIGAVVLFAVAAMVFAVGECCLSPTIPALVNELAPADAVGRYNGMNALAFTAGFMIGPAVAGAALGAGWGSRLFLTLAPVCIVVALGALALGRRGLARVDRPAHVDRPALEC